MNRKHISVILLVIGSILICLSIILAIFATDSKDIIGGADISTFVFVYFRESNGLNSAIALCGIISLSISLMVKLRKTK